MLIIAITQGQRKIPVQYAKRVVGQKVYGGQSSFSRSRSITRASCRSSSPTPSCSSADHHCRRRARPHLPFLVSSPTTAAGYTFHYVGLALLILFFSYFWVSVCSSRSRSRRPEKYGGYIPVRPRRADRELPRLHHDALDAGRRDLPHHHRHHPDGLLYQLKVPPRVRLFSSAHRMLITSGVILDTSARSKLSCCSAHYDGFLKKGPHPGRSTSPMSPSARPPARSR